jgi:hypothetical protein
MNKIDFKKTLITLILCFYTVGVAQAQSYSSLRLQMLGEMMPAKSIPEKDSVFECIKLLRGKQFTVTHNAKGEIEHLGVSLFSTETKALISLPICNFIERMMLDLLLHEKQGKLQNKLDEFKITLTKAGFLHEPINNLSGLLNNMQEPVQFSLYHEDKFYKVTWTFADYTGLEMTFPANRELIFGVNKKEADMSLNEALPQKHCTDTVSEKDFFSGTLSDTIDKKTGFSVRNGNYFIVKPLNNNQVYYKDANDKCHLVFDVSYPEISLKNLLLNPQMKSSLQLHVKHRMYGGFTPEFTTSLNDFTCFFQNGFDSYCFAERNKKGILEATLILHNRKYNYIHMLFVTVAPETLFSNGVLKAEFSTNIPQDNIKNLFEKN